MRRASPEVIQADRLAPRSNQSVERMGASRSGQRQLGRLRRLAPTAHAHRYPMASQ
jgi:hypothetical protein